MSPPDFGCLREPGRNGRFPLIIVQEAETSDMIMGLGGWPQLVPCYLVQSKPSFVQTGQS